jgi:hypothetical protein
MRLSSVFRIVADHRTAIECFTAKAGEIARISLSLRGPHRRIEGSKQLFEGGAIL